MMIVVHIVYLLLSHHVGCVLSASRPNYTSRVPGKGDLLRRMLKSLTNNNNELDNSRDISITHPLATNTKLSPDSIVEIGSYLELSVMFSLAPTIVLLGPKLDTREAPSMNLRGTIINMIHATSHAPALFQQACQEGRTSLVTDLIADPRNEACNITAVCLQVACRKYPLVKNKIKMDNSTEAFALVKALIDSGRVDLSVDYNIAICWASLNGHHALVLQLLNDDRVDPTARNNDAIHFASMYGHHLVVKLLIDIGRVDPYVNNNNAIILAIVNGHHDVVKVLLDDDRVYSTREAIRSAIIHCHFAVVKALIDSDRVDHDALNVALEYACRHNQEAIVEYLLSVINIKRVPTEAYQSKKCPSSCCIIM